MTAFPGTESTSHLDADDQLAARPWWPPSASNMDFLHWCKDAMPLISPRYDVIALANSNEDAWETVQEMVDNPTRAIQLNDLWGTITKAHRPLPPVPVVAVVATFSIEYADGNSIGFQTICKDNPGMPFNDGNLPAMIRRLVGMFGPFAS